MKRLLCFIAVQFFMISGLYAQRIIPEGFYIIRLAANPSFVIGLADNGNVCLQAYSGENLQKWELVSERLGNALGTIQFLNLGKAGYALGISDENVVNGSNVTSIVKKRDRNQLWFPYACNNGYIFRSAKKRELVIDLDHARMINGQNILLWPEHKGDGQIWKLERVGSDSVTDEKNLSRPDNSLVGTWKTQFEDDIFIYDECTINLLLAFKMGDKFSLEMNLTEDDGILSIQGTYSIVGFYNVNNNEVSLNLDPKTEKRKVNVDDPILDDPMKVIESVKEDMKKEGFSDKEIEEAINDIQKELKSDKELKRIQKKNKNESKKVQKEIEKEMKDLTINFTKFQVTEQTATKMIIKANEKVYTFEKVK